MLNQTLKKIYEDIAKDYGITTEEVEKIVVSQFMFVRKTMNEGVQNDPESFKSIQLTHLGKFAVRKHKLEEWKKKKK